MYISRKWYLVGFTTAVSLLGIAYFYFQKELGLVPCPLCMFQRACLVLIAIVCLIGWLHKPRMFGSRVYAFFVGVFALTGAGIAGRQVWLQHLPKDQVPECGFDPVYRYLDEESGYGFLEMLSTTLKGSGDCAHVDWSFLGMSMAMWMLIIFSVMVIITISLYRKQRKMFS